MSCRVNTVEAVVEMNEQEFSASEYKGLWHRVPNRRGGIVPPQ